jgi:hypothetical protein
MLRTPTIVLTAAFASMLWADTRSVEAACPLPYTIANGQLGDARQVMANFDATKGCVDRASPGGSPFALQYNSGAGMLAGAAPLADGQVLVGSASGIPQALPFPPGLGIFIARGAGSITISQSAGIKGLYGDLMSATPTSASTGLTNWLNQGSAVIADSLVGASMDVPSGGSTDNITGRYKAAPSAPYTITVLVAATRNSSLSNAVGLGWYDGTSMLHLISYGPNNGGLPFLRITKWNSTSSFSAADFTSSNNGFSQPIWLQIADDGTNVSFAFSQDGANFVPLFSVAKASGFLGATGYSNIIFYANPLGSRTLATLMSWKEE